MHITEGQFPILILFTFSSIKFADFYVFLTNLKANSRCRSYMTYAVLNEFTKHCRSARCLFTQIYMHSKCKLALSS
jgi:hypothetical protein